MLTISVVVLSILCGVSAAPKVKRFDAFESLGFPFTYTYTRPFGAFASAGAFPFLQPYPSWYPSIPMPMPVPDYSRLYIPWYKGENVCETKKVIDESDEMKEMNEWLDGVDDGTVEFSQESYNCKGNNNKHVCVRRVRTNEGSKVEITKYECCYGFVRSLIGDSGCVESYNAKKNNPVTAVPSTFSSQTKMKDSYKYTFVTDDSKLKSGVEKVPIE